MPNLEYFLVAQSSSFDVRRNSISLFHVLNDVRLAVIPGIIPELVLASAWMSSEDEIGTKAESQLRFEFSLPGSTEMQVFRGNLTSEVRFQNFNVSIADVPVERSGDMIVRLFLNDVSVATHTMNIATVGD